MGISEKDFEAMTGKKLKPVKSVQDRLIEQGLESFEVSKNGIKNGKISKFRNVIVYEDGDRFDSKRELGRYKELKVLQTNGNILNLKKQVPFLLQEGFRYKGEKIRAIKYIADFVYELPDGRKICEDSKGMRTEVFKIKRKMFLKKYRDTYEFIET